MMSDKEDALIQILRDLHGKSVDDLADKIIALFHEPARWKPAKGEQYWMIQNDGMVESYPYADDTSDEQKWRFGNCFQTQEHATIARDRVKEVLLNFHKTHGK